MYCVGAYPQRTVKLQITTLQHSLIWIFFPLLYVPVSPPLFTSRRCKEKLEREKRDIGPKSKGTLTVQKILPMSVDAAFGRDGAAGAFPELDGAMVFSISRGCDASGFSVFVIAWGLYFCRSL